MQNKAGRRDRLGQRHLNISDRAKVLLEVLRIEIERFKAETGMSAKEMARMAGFSDALLRGIQTDQWQPSPQTLSRLERALAAHPAWKLDESVPTVLLQADEDVLLSKQPDLKHCPHFEGITWMVQNDKMDMDIAMTHPNITVIDVRPEDPREFRLHKWAGDTAKSPLGGIHPDKIDKSEKRVWYRRRYAFVFDVVRQHLWMKYTGEPTFKELYWARDSDAQREGSAWCRFIFPIVKGEFHGSVVQRYHHHQQIVWKQFAKADAVY